MSPEQWQPAAPKLTCGTLGGRSRDNYRKVVDQFDVEHNPRYTPNQPTKGTTWCNLLAWDVTRAMGCELPHWWGPKELPVNALWTWLMSHGADYDWTLCSEKLAAMNANQGRPTVAIWKNPDDGPGHIAVVLPGSTERAVLIAQAGARNFVGEPLAHGFGGLSVNFWIHP